ncbi:ABC transporter, ATP-binding protein [mine drainage metagenome]|uniref:ABC transporter, ATP-binding protein n=1 Tax=mine drainage metagenome TaxID=410659 RepID=T0Y0B5_9ZZZZ
MAEVRSIIRGLKKSQRLIFMSSHILSEVVDVCDDVALIDRGKLLFYDTLPNVTARFSDGGASLDLQFARPVPPDAVPGRIARLPGVHDVTFLDPRRLRVKYAGGAATQEQLVESVAQMRLGLLSAAASESALERST